MVDPRNDLQVIGATNLDQMGGVAMCSVTYPSPCPGLMISNNIAAGTVQQGFTGPGHDCDSENRNFFNNVAHSISGGLSGNGFIVYPDPSKPEHSNCYETSNNAVYKVSDAGILANFPTKKVQMHTITAIECHIGA